MSQSTVKQRIYDVLEVARRRDRLSQVVQWSLIVLIVLNVSAFVFATVPHLRARYGQLFLWFERISMGVFTVEYVLRLWVCTEDERFAGHPVTGRLRYMVTPAALIDLLAIVPFYLPRAVGSIDFRAIRILRVFRLLRLLKLGRFSKSIGIFGQVIRNKGEQLMIAGIVVSVLLVLASSLMYVAEHRVQPEAFSSIPASMWWGVVTLTTVGYGDVTPVTVPGRILGGAIAVLGIGLFALPAGILSSGFEEALDTFGSDDDARERVEPAYCPHCGEPLDGHPAEDDSVEGDPAEDDSAEGGSAEGKPAGDESSGNA